MPPLKIVAKKIPQLADFCTATLAGFYSAVDIAREDSVSRCDSHVFTFLSEVPANLQQAFIEEMGVSKDAVLSVAEGFSELASFDVALRGQQTVGRTTSLQRLIAQTD